MAPSEEQRRILFVGAFPTEDLRDVRGGQLSTCAAIASSRLWRRYDFVPFDSTQRSIPPPPLTVRGVLAAARFYRFVVALIFGDVTDVVVMCAERAGAIDKGAMIILSRLVGKRTAFYPVAHGLFLDAKRHVLWRWWLRLVVASSTITICQGKGTVDEVVTLGASRSRCHVVPNPIQLLDWYGDFESQSRDGILFAGWINERKGVFDLLEAIRDSDTLRSERVLMCGSGPAKDRAQQWAHDAGLANVHFAGWVTPEELQPLMKSAAIFVLPSHSEGLPQSVVEAFAAGAVVVTTPVGAIPDYVIDDETGSIVPPGRPDLLRAALELLIRDPARQERLRAAGQEVARTLFDADEACDALGGALEAMGVAPRGR